MKLTIDYLEEERFFGGTVNDGIFMPYSAGFSRDLRVWHAGNQASSFLLSDRGRTIYSDKPFKYEFFSDHMEVEGEDIFVERNGDTLKSAYTSMCKKFAPAGKNTIPPASRAAWTGAVSFAMPSPLAPKSRTLFIYFIPVISST